MPLLSGKSAKTISKNIAEMLKSPTVAPDKPQKKRAQMASAAAHNKARKKKRSLTDKMKGCCHG